MGKAYGEDLRLKALAALDGGMKKMAIHQNFGIARSTLDDWIQLRLQQGHVVPVARRPRTGHGFFNAKEFEAFVHQPGHKTLGQMRLVWQQEHGQLLSEKTFSRCVRIAFNRPRTRTNIRRAVRRNIMCLGRSVTALRAIHSRL